MIFVQQVIPYVALFFIFSGFFFLLVGVVGLLRLPDVYTRMHAMGKCDTLGTGMVLIGLMLLFADITNVTKLLLIAAMIATINPVVTHLIAKTAYNRGTPMAEGSFLINDYVASQRRRRRQPLVTEPEKGGDIC
ncbi:MAG: monovalent cation/H(+) antiporter subunit G [Firmicutes bacterium]|nr:monovalent cation/H(+) antiporter subunit G [Bacillota bacterium]